MKPPYPEPEQAPAVDMSGAPIRVDYRRGSGELLSLFPAGLAEEWDLPSGDFEIPTENGPEGACLIGVERKAIRDLLGSMRDGRLVGQLRVMADKFQFSYLIVEGRYRENSDGYIESPGRRSSYWNVVKLGTQRFHHAELAQFLQSIRMQTEVRVITTEDERGTVREVMTIERWFRKPWNKHTAVSALRSNTVEDLRSAGRDSGRLHGWIDNRKIPRVAKVAYQLDGIGADRAWLVSDNYRTVEQLCLSDAAELTRIEGIGSTTAGNLLRQLREPED